MLYFVWMEQWLLKFKAEQAERERWSQKKRQMPENENCPSNSMAQNQNPANWIILENQQEISVECSEWVLSLKFTEFCVSIYQNKHCIKRHNKLLYLMHFMQFWHQHFYININQYFISYICFSFDLLSLKNRTLWFPFISWSLWGVYIA